MMNVNNILSDTSNRQYPLPQKKWKYFQEWHNTMFFHWKVPPELLERYIPEGIELDTKDNTAWVSLVAFEVKNMRLRSLPPIPYISNFNEINLRTYVIKDGIPGIYFFSIETDKFIEVILTRMFIGLPYEKSKMKRTLNSLCSENKISDYHLNIEFDDRTKWIKKTELDKWLTERLSLYENCNNKIYRFDIHHKEWKIRDFNAEISAICYNVGKFKLNLYPDKLHYSAKLDVILWGKEQV